VIDDDRLDAGAARDFYAQLGERKLNPLTVVIPAYNEEDGIVDVLTRIPGTVCGLEVDVIVMVDGGSDRTAERARAVPGVLVCEFPVNLGQGVAFQIGYALARDGGAQYIATLDADGQFDPAELPLVVEPLVSGKADFVNGSRRLGLSHNTDRMRETGVVVFGRLISLLARTKITDPANGLRAFRAEVTAVVPLRQPQYQTSEMLLGTVYRGFRLVEVPATMHRRSAGATKKGPNLLYGFRFARVILGTWWRLAVVERLPLTRPSRRRPVGEHDDFVTNEFGEEQRGVGRDVRTSHESSSY
jgi:glycosyltransferase involved in cell wall biosynthesis